MEILALTLAVLYGLAMAALLVYGVQLLILAVSAAGGKPVAPSARSTSHSDVPVTIQLPLYNEPAVAARIIDSVASIDYPHDLLQIQVLDDSDDTTHQIVADRVAFWTSRGVDIEHLRRGSRAGYKAGALASAIHRAKGEFVAVFDADFIPPRDFLQRVLPHFTSPTIGMVQARWGHLNARASALTRVQAFGLDTHFAVEQEGRHRAGVFMSFNGTAGVWRRACIEDAGGWSADTLAEDLDLSYRAQLRGWAFRYVNDLEVPAELPANMPDVRTQQYRWTKGAAETARKLMGRMLRAPDRLRTRVLGGLHLTAHAAFPALLLAALTHAPMMATQDGFGSPVFLSVLGIGIVGFVGFLMAHLVAQRRLHADWLRRLGILPLFLIGSIGLSAHNTMAFIDGLRGRRTPFIRTPKTAGAGASRGAAKHLPLIVWAEAVLAVYSVLGLLLLIRTGTWEAIPFQLMFVLGFGTVSVHHIVDTRLPALSVSEAAAN